MAIARDNTFHLLLSDDELKLLKLLAEREGLNASDYLRMLIRTMPTSAAQLRLGAAVAGKADLAKLFEMYADAFKLAKTSAEEPKKAK
jgi:hypothetical protein